MKSTLLSATVVFALFALSIGSCKKKETMAVPSTSGCTSTIYGYSGSSWLDTNNYFGVVNTSAATISSSGTLMHYMLYSNQGAYNGADGYYYTLQATNNSSQSVGPLYKINSGGAVITMAAASGAGPYASLTYNKATNKLYCIAAGNLAEVTPGSSSFTTTSIASPVHRFYVGYTSSSMTVNNNNGDLYYVTGDTAGYFIEKYHAGAGSTVVATGGAAWEILGMRYNENDNRLYAIRMKFVGTTPIYDLITIDPSSGTISSLTTLAVCNPEFFSACINPCTNRYIFSTMGATGAILDQYSITGSLLQHDTLSAPFMGLDVWTTSM